EGPGADLRQGPDQSGRVGGGPLRLAAGGMRAIRRGGDQDHQDVPGDVAAGRGGDPGGAGQGGGRLAAGLLHQAGGDGGGGPGGDGGSGGAGADEQGRQGRVGGGRAAGPQRVQQHRLLQPEPVDVLGGGSVGLGQGGRGSGGPKGQPLGPGVAAPVSCG